MFAYSRYLTQLDLVKENMGKNNELSRISLILIDNCLELFCLEYIKWNYPKEDKIHSSIDFKKKLNAVLEFNHNNKIITPDRHSIILLFHYYRNKLYHYGELEGINLIFDHLAIYFNVVVDIILFLRQEDEFLFGWSASDLSTLTKYNPKCSKICFGPINFQSIKEAFAEIKFEIDDSSVRSDFINMLESLVSNWDEGTSRILSLGQKRTIFEELKNCFENHPQKNNNSKFEEQYEKYSKDADKILIKFEQIKKHKNSSRFFSDVLKFEIQLLFLMELINEQLISVNRFIDMQIDEWKMAKYEK